jgi:protein-disulfide isomerase
MAYVTSKSGPPFTRRSRPAGSHRSANKDGDMLKIDRRVFIAGSAATALTLSPAAWAQATVNVEDLHAPGPLGEKVLGPASAPVTVVEYASMSCPHCAHFDTATFDDFRLRYIDSGKVRYIFREFPLNAPAYAVAMVARCAPADRFFEIIHTYFRSQEKWLSSQDLRGAILEIAKPFGFTEQSFEACLSNQALFEGLENVRSRGAAFGVQATPTFFINGRKMEGALSLDDLQKAIDPLL